MFSLTPVAGYVNRDGMAAADWTIGDFTTDGAWHNLSLAGKVPAGCKAVVLRVDIQDDAAGSWILISQNQDVLNSNNIYCLTQVADMQLQFPVICSVEPGLTISYKTLNTVFDVLSISVQGYFV